MTQLTLRCQGAEATCFHSMSDDRTLAARIPEKYPGYMDRFDLIQLLEESDRRGITAPWVDRLREIYGQPPTEDDGQPQ